MTLSELALAQHLDCPFRYFDSVDSTNDIAMDWLKKGAESGSIVLADEQRKGRGRKGRYWHTPAGVALAVSIILKPQQAYAHRISMIGALAVYDLCETIGVQNIGIKWPNDVQIDGKKVSGILPEAAWHDDKLIGVVLGMGINVRVKFEGELAQTATSLENTLNKPLNRSELVGILATRINFWMAQIESNTVLHTWQSRLNMLGKQVQVEDVVGEAQAIDASGALLLKLADGSIKTVMAGDLSLLSTRDEG